MRVLLLLLLAPEAIAPGGFTPTTSPPPPSPPPPDTTPLASSPAAPTPSSPPPSAPPLPGRIALADGVDGEWTVKSYTDVECVEGGYAYFWWDAAYHDLRQMADETAYDACDFAGAVDLSPPSTGTVTRFVPCPSRGGTTHLSCSYGQHCIYGQKVKLVSHPTATVFDSQGATLIHFDSYLHLMTLMGHHTEASGVLRLPRGYDNEDSATHLTELLWCLDDHCPAAIHDWPPAAAATAAQCESNIYNIAGFVTRKRPGANVTLARSYYAQSLAADASNCPTYVYLIDMYAGVDDHAQATATALQFCAHCDTASALAALAQGNFTTRSWQWPCTPPSAPPPVPDAPAVSPSPPPSPASPPHTPPLPRAPPPPLCDQTADYIVVGAGTGGSAAAAFLRRRGESFLWFEAGADESDRLANFSAVDPQSKPQSNWSPTALYTGANGTQMLYAIPESAGGMSAHYQGVSYWTEGDVEASLTLQAHEREALDFVVNHTLRDGVSCDARDARYHTHERASTAAAPGSPAHVSLPSCMYGTCRVTGSCQLNQYPLSLFGMTSAVAGWHRGSAFTEYGGDGAQFTTRATSLWLAPNGTTVRGVYLQPRAGGPTTLACARKAVLLATGVMGNAHLLVPDVLPEYEFFAQPVVVYANAAALAECTAGSHSGGTFHKRGATGFMSTFAACRGADGQTRLLFATPQAVNPRTRGRVQKTPSGTYTATLNLEEDASILADLRRDFSETTVMLFGVNATLDGTFQHAAYHWTGTNATVERSRVRGMDNLYVADAMGVTGTTDGWTSFNARVAGALAALRAVRVARVASTCTGVRSQYDAAGCCPAAGATECEFLKSVYQGRGCCAARR